MLTLVGRNDPCPCGSGKKYKKCHGKNASGDITTVIDSEISRLQGVFAQNYYQNFNYKLQARYQEWHEALQHAPHLPEGYLDIAVMDTTMYVDEPTEWKQFVESVVADDANREQVKNVFKQWAEPKLVLAEVTGNDDKVLNLKDVKTGETYAMPVSDSSKSAKWVFGIIFKDSRIAENGVSVSQSTLFIPEGLSMVTDIIKAKLENGTTDALELFKAFVEILENEVAEDETAPVEAKDVTATDAAIEEEDGDADAGEPVEAEEIVETEAVVAEEQTFEQEIAALVAGYLKEFNLEATDFVKAVDVYLAEATIKAKKAGAVAAGAILAGQTAGVIPEGGLTKVKDVAEHFDVSSSSLSKYRKEIAEYLAK
ncbi:YecA family protein [Kurthia massiliensis]|uniref:YecA family protein n=1 Tax=Kurthia massiliensis TaxID=1033739 RepID=UPI001EEFF293|nr:SEC-C metal-binding domain-containing protein [Kurthia massiliensis]